MPLVTNARIVEVRKEGGLTTAFLHYAIGCSIDCDGNKQLITRRSRQDGFGFEAAPTARDTVPLQKNGIIYPREIDGTKHIERRFILF